jgi:hypothetical protein
MSIEGWWVGFAQLIGVLRHMHFYAWDKGGCTCREGAVYLDLIFADVGDLG